MDCGQDIPGSSAGTLGVVLSSAAPAILTPGALILSLGRLPDEDAGMKDAEDLQFEQANAAINKAVNKFVSEIELMFGRWKDVVAPSYIVENALWQLCTEVPKLADDGLKDIFEPETLKLLEAMDEYRDSDR